MNGDFIKKRITDNLAVGIVTIPILVVMVYFDDIKELAIRAYHFVMEWFL